LIFRGSIDFWLGGIVDRRKFLKLAGLGGLGAMLPGAGHAGIRDLISRTAPMLDKPNILILMTDEQRATRDWPAGWADANLPSLGRLRAHGINFNSAFANACQCSPSRSSFLTSTYAPVNRATVTPATLNPALPNLATIFGAAGYEVVYKGKWHLTTSFVTPLSADSPQDISDIIANDEALETTYGFSGWNSPDAGTSLTQSASLGGGIGGNDARYVSGKSSGTVTNVIEFPSSYDFDAPFCLIVSLVNPHDVFIYPRGIEKELAYALAGENLPVAVVNPRQVSNFAKSACQRAKTDAIDRRGRNDAFCGGDEAGGATFTRCCLSRTLCAGDSSSAVD